jgi:hypothetical protein
MRRDKERRTKAEGEMRIESREKKEMEEEFRDKVVLR